MRTSALAMSLLLALPSPTTADLIITEVYYDHTGADADFEWEEVFNAGPGPVDLSDYTLGNGGTNYDFSTAALQGTIASCETFVIGAASTADNGAPAIDRVFDFDPDVQNAGSAADGVALFGPGADPAAECPLDAVIYGATNSNGLRDETCGIGTVDVGNAGSGPSIERTSFAGEWVIQTSPDPNAISFSISCDPVDTSTESWGTLKADYRN